MNQVIKTDLISGAGNTFHVAYSQAKFFLKLENSHRLMQKVSREICQKAPADGFIFLEKESNADLKWYFFNNDGSDAEMCGNATRCVGLMAQSIGMDVSKGIRLETIAGPIQIKSISQNSFEVVMTEPKKLNSKEHFFCDTGVPHLVIDFKTTGLFSSLTEELKLKSREIRFSAEFAPRGTNVTYVERTSDSARISAVSYERGVEDFTQACGTGAMAAAFENYSNRGIKITEVKMPGGTLKLNLTNLNAPTMTGPAEKIGSYEHDIQI